MSLRKIEEEDLRFTCELDGTTLNDSGKHYLRVSLGCDGGKEKLSNVTVTVGEGGSPESKPTAVTDIIYLTENSKDSPVKFARNKFIFTLPKGTCSDDSKKAVFLLISVFKSSPPSNKGVRVSGSSFDIFPRTEAPLAKLDGNRQELYTHDGLMTFKKTIKETGKKVAAGTTKFSVCLEIDEKPEEEAKDKKSEEKVKEKEEPKKEETKKEEPQKEDETKKEEAPKNEDKKKEESDKDKKVGDDKVKESVPQTTNSPKPKEEPPPEKPKSPPPKPQTPPPATPPPPKPATPPPPKPATPPPPKPATPPPPKPPTPPPPKPPMPPPPKSPTPPPKEKTPTPPPPKEKSPPPPQPKHKHEPDQESLHTAEKIIADFQATSSPLHSPRANRKSIATDSPVHMPRVNNRKSSLDDPVTKEITLELPVVEFRPPHRPRDLESPRRIGGHIGRGNTVAKAGHVEVHIIVHAASQLPKLPDGAIPKPYVIGRGKGKSKFHGQGGHRVTHSSLRPCLTPSWEELIIVEIKTKDIKKEAVQFLIVDQYTKTVLLEYELSLAYLKPFHQYHLDLVQSVEPDQPGFVQTSHLFLSVLLKTSQLPHLSVFGFQGLEVMLVAMEEPLSNPIGPLTAVARVVPDFFNYVQSISKQQMSSALKSLSIQFPTPHPSSFSESTFSSQSQFGHPQWTMPGYPDNQPVWNHTFMFCDRREVASMFNDTAALVIEFYPTTSTFNGNNWSLPQCCGYCSLLLDIQVREALMSDRGSMGVRVEHVAMQLTELYSRGFSNQAPSVELVLRLPTTVEPDTMVSVADIDALPSLETFQRSHYPSDEPPLFTRVDRSKVMTPPPGTSQPKKYMKNGPSHKPVNEVEAPTHSAIENILKLAKQPSPGNSSNGSHSGLIPTRLPPKSLQNGHHSSTPPSSTHSDKHALSLLDSQQKEINSYKDALKRMGEDIVRLQEDVAKLEMENSQLRRRINMHEDATKAMVDVKELDDMSRGDLIDKYVTLTRKLASQVEETSGYREKLVRMQNNMIKQNDREQQYLKQRDDFLKQQDELGNKQEKIKKLERTCVEQEKALDKMERILRNKLKTNKPEENYKTDDVNALAVENARLRSQIDQYRKTPPGKGGSSEDADKLRLHLQLEKAKGRVASLERELMEKAREWGKEKEGMRLRVGERHDNHRNRSLPPLHRDRGYSYLSDDESDDYRTPRHHQRHRHLSPLY